MHHHLFWLHAPAGVNAPGADLGVRRSAARRSGPRGGSRGTPAPARASSGADHEQWLGDGVEAEADADDEGLGEGFDGGGRAAHMYPSGNEGEPCVGGSHDTSGVVAAVVTVVFDRPDYLKRHAESLLAVHGSDRLNRCARLGRHRVPLRGGFSSVGKRRSSALGVLKMDRMGAGGLGCRSLIQLFAIRVRLFEGRGVMQGRKIKCPVVSPLYLVV